MDDNNIINFLDSASKNLQRGAVPIVIEDIDKLIHLLLGKKKSKNRFGLIHIPQLLPGQEEPEAHKELVEMKQKYNEMAIFLNERFTL